MTTYVINMEKDVEKRAQIESQLSEQTDLNYKIIKAVEGRKLTKEEIDRLADMHEFKTRYNTFATLPALGCSLSHYFLYQLIAESEDHCALILEDDALLSPDLKSSIPKVERFLNSDEPVAILLTPEFSYSPTSAIKLDDNLNIHPLSDGIMTSGYYINKAAAKLLAGHLMPIRYLADAWKDFVAVGLKLYGIVPHLISYPEGMGEIGLSQHTNNNKTQWEEIRYKLAKIKGKIWEFLFVYLKGQKRSPKKW